MIKLSPQQKEILLGTVLGDAYLQKTGERNARLRLEHSVKQRDYIFWKHIQLRNLFSSNPRKLERYNPVFRKRYTYWRCQSNSTPLLGKLRRCFYEDSRKAVPEDLGKYLNSPLTLAVWYMDDGYYYQRDKVAYLYLPQYGVGDVARIQEVLREKFSLSTCCHIKKGKKGYCLYFPVEETRKLVAIISPHVIESMHYKLPPNPVSTDRKSHRV